MNHMSKLIGLGVAALVLGSIVPRIAAESCGRIGGKPSMQRFHLEKRDSDVAHAKHGLITQTVST
jgi:hypothetical protein